MIITVDDSNLLQAAVIHSIAWQESHRSFSAPDFVELHTPEHQQEYLMDKMKNGSQIYMLIAEKPAGIVSVTDSLIEDLYILPEEQNKGYGTKLLQYAIRKCPGIPTLWILENNVDAERLYRRMGFRRTGKTNAITEELNEIEFELR